MSIINSFAPVAGVDASRLILGSMPGLASLQAGQYYAHQRNAFWPMMEAILAFSSALPYQDRCQVLIDNGIALWDVLSSCERTGSLDAAIVTQSMVPNDFASFYRHHRQVRTIYFNGAMAEKVYRRQVMPLLPSAFADLTAIRLPSTSPAHAALSFEQKRQYWQIVAC